MDWVSVRAFQTGGRMRLILEPAYIEGIPWPIWHKTIAFIANNVEQGRNGYGGIVRFAFHTLI